MSWKPGQGRDAKEHPLADVYKRQRVDGLDWQARTVDGTPLPKDARCEVKNVDGAVLIVSCLLYTSISCF